MEAAPRWGVTSLSLPSRGLAVPEEGQGPGQVGESRGRWAGEYQCLAAHGCSWGDSPGSEHMQHPLAARRAPKTIGAPSGSLGGKGAKPGAR